MSANGRDVILALDTATPVGSVALCTAERIVVSRYFDVGLQHSQRLFGEVDAALAAADMDVGEVRAVAVTIGPGSFTGLRIGLSAAKGLCLAAVKELVTVSTLEALAARLPFARLPVCPVLDARKREVYAALYNTATGVPVELAPPRAIAPAQLARERANAATIFTGDGGHGLSRSVGRQLGRAVCSPALRPSRCWDYWLAGTVQAGEGSDCGFGFSGT